jgi:predicted metal-binding protein
MLNVPKKYIVDKNNKKIAVQLNIKTFEKIEEILENYSLVQLMKENKREEKLSVSEAKAYYKTQSKH